MPRFLTPVAAPFLALTVLLVGCGEGAPAGSEAAATGSEPEATPASPLPSEPEASPGSPAAAPTPRTENASGTEVIAADSDYGRILYDASGQAIYLFDKETSSAPDCYGECAEAWPPVLTRGEPLAGRGVREALLGTTRRRDGTTQATYAGRPLYFYAHEGKYQVLCHDVEEYGGTWLVVQPDGRPAPP